MNADDAHAAGAARRAASWPRSTSSSTRSRAATTTSTPSSTRRIGSPKIRLLVHEDSTRYGQALIGEGAERSSRETFPPGYRVRYTGTLASTAAATEVMVEGKLRNIAADRAHHDRRSPAILLRSLVGGLLVAVPLALAVAVNFGVMGAARHPARHA